MQLEEAVRKINECALAMNAHYGGIVFDEWLIVVTGKMDTILAHSGPRGDLIVQDFEADTKAIHALLQASPNATGDFGFTEQGHGTLFDAYTVLGPDVYLLWNNTNRSTGDITQNPRWRTVQSEFAAFARSVKADPVDIR